MYWPSVRSRWLDIGRVLFLFFFFFFAFLWTVTSQSSEKCKKRNDANIQLSWPNEQYEFDIIRIKMTCLFWETGKKSKCRERFLFVLSRTWDKEKILSPHEESNLRPSDSGLRRFSHWATETPRWARRVTRESFNVFVVLNVFCCSKFSISPPPLSTLSATTDPHSVPWKPCHPLKSPNPFSLKINNDRCGPLDTILRGQFYWSYTRKIITWVARTFCDLYAHLEYAERLFKNKTFKKSLLRS